MAVPLRVGRLDRATLAVFIIGTAAALGAAALIVRWDESPTRVVGLVVLTSVTVWLLLRPRAALLAIAGSWGLAHSILAAADVGGNVGGASLNLSRAIGVAIALGLGLSLLGGRRHEVPLARPLRVLLWFLVVYAFDAALTSSAAGAADLVRVGSGVLAGVAAFLFFDSVERILVLARVVTACGIAVASITIAQFALARAAPGVAAAIFGSASYTYSYNSNDSLAAVRVLGPLGGPGETAGFLLVAIAFALLRHAVLRGSAPSRLRGLGIAVMCAAITATLTRSSLAALLLLIALFVIQRQIPTLSAAGVRVKVLVLVAAAAAVAVPAIGAENIHARLWDLNPTTSGGNFAQGRARIWSAAYAELRHSSLPNLFLGHGSHSSYTNLVAPNGTVVAFSPHNLVVWLVLETGAVGLALYLAFLIGAGRIFLARSRSARYQPAGQIAAIALATLAAYQLQGMFTLSPNNPGHGLYFMLFIGAALRLSVSPPRPIANEGGR
jgi:O-antigen ligase